MTGVLLIAAVAAAIALGLTICARRYGPDDAGPIEAVNRLLPQTQCGQCGYPGCRPYAEAIVAGEEDIDRCPPGGDSTVSAIAHLLGRAEAAKERRAGAAAAPGVAFIDENLCIGCARCLDACPVDAIIGAPRYMHTIIRSECTGCELCIPPCPVDCISIEPASGTAA